MGKIKLTTEQFIERAKLIHGDKYDYSRVNYKGNTEKVCIICPKHGEFWQTPASHLKGCGCFKCGVEDSAKGHLSNKDEFVRKAKNIFGISYDYSKVNYTKSSEKIIIKCNKCGHEFLISPNNHLKGQGCPICAKDKKGRQRKQMQEFIEDAREIHGDKYDYSKVNYKGNTEKVCIICPKHGEFWQRPSSHLRGKGCPYCNESKLEIEVESILTENNVNFIKQCRKDTLGWLDKLSLDFYLPEYNIAIECQGKQHFEPIEIFGGENEFNKQIERDNRKATLCLEHGVKLIYYTKPSLKPLYEVITDEEQLVNMIKNDNTLQAERLL